MYQGQPDFRPIPTLESACGIPPDFPEIPKSEPLPAGLLARWPLDEEHQGPVKDAAADGRHARISNATWTEDGERGKQLTLNGNGYVAAAGLGVQPAISVSLWVKPSRLPNRWNPLLFSDGASRGAFHFSLLQDGTPNVAINSGPSQWTHRRALTPLPIGQWRHLVVVCDPRFGGAIRFYVNGKRDADLPVGLGVPLDLESFRLGAYRSWENNPTAGFHGALADIRVYRGTLTEVEITEVFEEGR
jgi:hypothetical protein